MKKFLHNVLGWGYPEKVIHGEPFQSTWSCKFCDGTVTQDSLGNWFHLSGKAKDSNLDKEGYDKLD